MSDHLPETDKPFLPALLFNATLAAVSALIFLLVFLLNEAVFNSERFEVVRGINWIYLPAGARLLCTLLFGGAGAVGILLASWITCVFYFFPDDPVRALAGGLASAAAPYLVYKLAQHLYGLNSNLRNLGAKRLLVLICSFSIANPVLHHVWLLVRGDEVGLNFLVMVLGDLLGTLAVIYVIKGLSSFLSGTRVRE